MDTCRRWGRHMSKHLGRNFCITGLLAATALLGACAGPSGFSTLGAAECKQISKRAEAKINWARVPQIELRVRDGAFSPMVAHMKQGRPYILRIRNRDDKVRIFRAGDFFEKNAVIAAALEGQRVPETCIRAVSLPPRQTAEIRMVAITDGTYEYEDNFILLPFVMSAGPSGAIIVEERRETAGIN